ncbi:hypothetical protein K470DRAFT_288459 [Piedraia hortae CBS 480.64]|uniref:Uncharacterized protein n=1 Tax=Piedraia hortae CBS 480.64 TaxID=1314780 RepID=A0A6A7BVF7_9PEZI|nr:hypothetical protein K470DRAFT_288459 [Piedraia hortae CBS 480.64]
MTMLSLVPNEAGLLRPSLMGPRLTSLKLPREMPRKLVKQWRSGRSGSAAWQSATGAPSRLTALKDPRDPRQFRETALDTRDDQERDALKLVQNDNAVEDFTLLENNAKKLRESVEQTKSESGVIKGVEGILASLHRFREPGAALASMKPLPIGGVGGGINVLTVQRARDDIYMCDRETYGSWREGLNDQLKQFETELTNTVLRLEGKVDLVNLELDLKDLSEAKGAVHDTQDSFCYPGTRVAILEDLTRWASIPPEGEKIL